MSIAGVSPSVAKPVASTEFSGRGVWRRNFNGSPLKEVKLNLLILDLPHFIL